MAEQPDITPEELEGLGDKDKVLSDDYPIDTLLIRPETRTIHDVMRRIKQGTYIMDPEFQRDFIWPEDKQSKLIESVLMRIPLPVFYLAENDQGRMVVVDGLQRLSTFEHFVDGKLRLAIPGKDELNRKRFKDLPPKLQNRVEDCNLIFYIMDSKVPDRVRLDIFERVNGGIPLTRQQMRNCLFMGRATRFLKAEARTEVFLRATGGSLNKDTMRDREFVNRFCAFQLLSVRGYRGDMDDFLAQVLKEMNGLEPRELRRLSTKFRKSLTNNYKVFGKHAFRKHQNVHSRRSVLNASLWDVMSTGLSRYPEEMVESHARTLRRAFHLLLRDNEFLAAVTYSTNQAKQVRYRFCRANAMFEEVFGAYTA